VNQNRRGKGSGEITSRPSFIAFCISTFDRITVLDFLTQVVFSESTATVRIYSLPGRRTRGKEM